MFYLSKNKIRGKPIKYTKAPLITKNPKRITSKMRGFWLIITENPLFIGVARNYEKNEM
jgi:hypothetical protein